MTRSAGSPNNGGYRPSRFAPGYSQYIKSQEWRDFRALYYSVYPKVCRLCGSPGVQNLHHLDHQNFRSKSFRDYLSLCILHHNQITAGFQKRSNRRQNMREYTMLFIASKGRIK